MSLGISSKQSLKFFLIFVFLSVFCCYGSTPLLSPYLGGVAEATYTGIQSMIEPRTGLPHDQFDAVLADIFLQFAVARTLPYTLADGDHAARLAWGRCQLDECRLSTNYDYGLKLSYVIPVGAWGASFNLEAPSFDVSRAQNLEIWLKGAVGGEKMEIVLWNNCAGNFPGRPASAELTATSDWQKRTIPLSDYRSFVSGNLGSLCRLSIGFNPDLDPKPGTIFLDRIAFVDAAGQPVHVPVDETTSVTNIGLYIASLLGAVDLGLEQLYGEAGVASRLDTTLRSIESFRKWHGFPQTHNHVVSLQPSSTDRCISFVDSGYVAAGLMLLRQRVPELAGRAGKLLDDMEWDWFYDRDVHLPFACRYPDDSQSPAGHFEWLAADSRLAHLIAIGTGKIPPESWQYLDRSQEPERCGDQWHFAPGWKGGGLFMALLPELFLDESGSELGTSATNFVNDQVCLAGGLGSPAWGWSACALPPDGSSYCGYGCIADNVLAPYASLLAAEIVGSDKLADNLQALEALGARRFVPDGGVGVDFGFRDSVNWRFPDVVPVYLVLDQSMGFLSLVNLATDGGIRKSFCKDPVTGSAINLIPDYSNACPALR